MALAADLTPAEPSIFWTRITQLKPAMVAIGDAILQKQQDGTWEPALASDLVGNVIGAVTDAGMHQDFAEHLAAGVRKLGPYTTTLRLWGDWVGKLAGGNGHDLVALLAVRELLTTFASATWSTGASSSRVGASGVHLGGSANVGGSASVGSSTSFAPILSYQKASGKAGIDTTRTINGRGASTGVSATGGTGRSTSTIAGDSAGLSVPLGQYLVPSLGVLDLLIASESATIPLSTADVMDLVARGQISVADAHLRVSSNGDLWEDQLRLLQAQAPQPTVEQWIEYGLRQNQPEAQVDQYLRRAGWVDHDYAQVLKLLHFRVLSAGEIIGLAGNRLDSDALAQRYGLDDRMADSQAGIYGQALRAQGIAPDVWRAVWRGHWDLGGPSLADEALHRLRPGLVPANQEFGLDDYVNHLRMAGVPEYWIDRRLALSQVPPGNRQIVQLLQGGGLNQATAVSAYRDLGYGADSAQALASFAAQRAAAQNASQGHGFTSAEIVKLWVEHAMDEPTAVAWLRQLLLTDAQIDTIRARVIGERLASQRRERIAAIKHAFVAGSIIDSDAIIKLGEIGIVGADAQFEIDTWKLLQSHHAHPLSRAEVVQLLKDGLITGDQYVLRLRLLGYTADDAQASLAIVLAGLRGAQAKAVAAQTRAAQRAASVQQSALARARSAAARAAAHLSRLRAQAVNAEQHAAFVQEQASRVQQVKDQLADMPAGPDKKKAENALARATKSDAAAQQEAERQRLLAAEGAP